MRDGLRRGHGTRRYTRMARPLRLRRAARGALLCVSLACAVLVALRLFEYADARREYAHYQRLASETTALTAQVAASPVPTAQRMPRWWVAEAVEIGDVPAPRSEPTQTPAPAAQSELVRQLRRENADAVGWLSIAGTGVDYPFVQGDDNAYYAKYTFDRRKNGGGAIFLDAHSQADFSDFNTVIYGHNMRDGSMFGTLDSYEKQAFLDKHMTIRVELIDRVLVYRVFAVYTSNGADDFDFRGPRTYTQAQKRQFIEGVRARAGNYSRVPVSWDDRLLALATCTDGRTSSYVVVHAVLEEELAII